MDPSGRCSKNLGYNTTWTQELLNRFERRRITEKKAEQERKAYLDAYAGMAFGPDDIAGFHASNWGNYISPIIEEDPWGSVHDFALGALDALLPIPTDLNTRAIHPELYMTGSMLFSVVPTGYLDSVDNFGDIAKTGYSTASYSFAYAGAYGNAAVVTGNVAVNWENALSVGAYAEGMFSMYGTSGTMLSQASGSSSRIITNSAGQEVQRKYVEDQDALLKVAEDFAGGDLDNLTEIKPGWYQNKEGTLKIEWNPYGHATTNEGPHVTIRIKNEKGGWSVLQKYFIEGMDFYK